MVDIPLLKQNVLNFLSQNGPSVPVRISSVLGFDSFFAGAILSELFAEKRVKISAAKLGRSPVYYLPDQEARLDMLFPHLPDKEKEAYNFLKEKKFVKDTEAVPSIRVAFRMMKDFAVPVTVRTSLGEELYWRWFLTSDEELKVLQTVAVQQPRMKIEEKPLAVQETLVTSRPKVKEQRQQKPDAFSDMVRDYLKNNNLIPLDFHIVRKNQEVDATIKVQSGLGELEVFLVAKNKKTISDVDLTVAYQKGLNKRLPMIFLTNGALTKKAKQQMEKHLRGYVLLKTL